jgi:diaminopimelate decarboxylase
MNYIYSKVSSEKKFFGNTDPVQLTEKFGTPLYVYNENILRERCRDLKQFISYKNFYVNYSAKANGNLELIKIIKDEGLRVDAMSPGEIHVCLMAGYKPKEIFFVPNNVGEDEFMYAIHAGVRVSVDSLSQLEMYGRLNPGGEIAFRLNPGVGDGHHEKVITGGAKTKFGIDMQLIPNLKRIIKDHRLKLIGINQHIGSLFMDGDKYLKGTETILSLARQFEDLEFIDLGGGFGIPYKKQSKQARLDLTDLGEKLSEVIGNWVKDYGKEIDFKLNPEGMLLQKVAFCLEKYML